MITLQSSVSDIKSENNLILLMELVKLADKTVFFFKSIINVCIFFYFFCLPPCDRAVASLTRDYLSPQFPHCLLAAVCSIGPTQAWRAEVQHRKTENTKQRQRERQRDRETDRERQRQRRRQKGREREAERKL